MSQFKETLSSGVPVSAGGMSASVSATAVGYPPGTSATARGLIELDDTIDTNDVTERGPLPVTGNGNLTQTRTTVLPRRARKSGTESEQGTGERPRFHAVRQLGEGAVGTVELQRDNDIRRTVAIKKLRSDARSEGAFLRFADEVRIVGQLEHPNIVPIYDVGRDEAGDVYLVMKHLEGETMEDVINKLRAGDPAYTQRFSLQFRAHLFLSILDAMRYAHARGILHRDLKPANIMVGLYDEVTIMDWGIAKPIGKRQALATNLDASKSWLGSQDQRLLETQMGTLAGTPLYMSPEQAAGQNDSLDERSDVFALGMVFYEWLTLEHPLAQKATLIEVLAQIISQELGRDALMPRAVAAGVSCEYIYLLEHALRRDRDKRTKDVATMYEQLKAILEGRVHVQCAVTFTKRATSNTLRWVDRHPYAFLVLAFTGSLTILLAFASLVWTVIRMVS